MNFNIRKLTKYNIYHVVFETQYELTSTMVRIQEFYESEFPNIKGKVFTLDQFMDEYSKRTGDFSYFTDWVGFNIPSNIFKEFYKLYKYQLRYKENKLFEELDWLTNSKYQDMAWYMIATHEEDFQNQTTLDHEICHALYYLNTDYAVEMIKNTGKMNQIYLKDLKRHLTDDGYAKNVLIDETQAYLSTSSIMELRTEYGLEGITEKDTEPFKETFKKYTKGVK